MWYFSQLIYGQYAGVHEFPYMEGFNFMREQATRKLDVMYNSTFFTGFCITVYFCSIKKIKKILKK